MQKRLFVVLAVAVMIVLAVYLALELVKMY